MLVFNTNTDIVCVAGIRKNHIFCPQLGKFWQTNFALSHSFFGVHKIPCSFTRCFIFSTINFQILNSSIIIRMDQLFGKTDKSWILSLLLVGVWNSGHNLSLEKVSFLLIHLLFIIKFWSSVFFYNSSFYWKLGIHLSIAMNCLVLKQPFHEI